MDVIAAIATGSAATAIGIVRVSGDGCFALCGRSVESLRRNVTNLLPQWTEGIFRIEEKRSQNRLTVWSGNRSNDYYLFGGHDESSFAAIQGITLAGVQG